MIMKSELNNQNTINAINMYDVPFLAYGIPILDWTVTELEIVDRETRKMLQQHHSMHIQSYVTLKRATESMICAVQEQAITTRHIQRRIYQTTTNDQCRLCRRATETIYHVISGCTVMAPTKYLQRHDNVCKYVHDQLFLEYGFKESATAWYQHQPRAVEENENVKILWNFSVQTDHTIQHNKPDIVVIDKRTKMARIIEIAIPNDNKHLSKEVR